MTLWNPDSWPEPAATAAFVISFFAFLTPFGVVLALRAAGRPTARATRWAFVVGGLLLLFLNPVLQFLSLGLVDDALRSRWEERARSAHLVGMSTAQVVALFGEPCDRRDERAPAVCEASTCREVGAPYTAWDYAPLPIFWLSHAVHFKVFFENGRATGISRGG